MGILPAISMAETEKQLKYFRTKIFLVCEVFYFSQMATNWSVEGPSTLA